MNIQSQNFLCEAGILCSLNTASCPASPFCLWLRPLGPSRCRQTVRPAPGCSRLTCFQVSSTLQHESAFQCFSGLTDTQCTEPPHRSSRHRCTDTRCGLVLSPFGCVNSAAVHVGVRCLRESSLSVLDRDLGRESLGYTTVPFNFRGSASTRNV